MILVTKSKAGEIEEMGYRACRMFFSPFPFISLEYLVSFPHNVS